MTWFAYLVQVNVYLTLFYAFYFIFLRNETYFTLNRIVLVGSGTFSFIIPLIQSDQIRSYFITDTVYQAARSVKTIYLTPANVLLQEQNDTNWLLVIYISGTALFFGRFLLRLFSAVRCRPSEATQPYSFFHRIVVPDHIKVKEPVMKHEEIHVKQWHSADIILFELISAVNWINPVTYLYKKAIRSVHEFIADGSAVKKAGSVSDYSLLLLGETLGTPASFLANNFFNGSLLKKRIIMLTKTKSKRSALIKYGLTIPLFLLMVIFSSATLDAGAVIRKTRINIDTAGKSTAAGDTSIHDFAAIDVLPNFPGGMPMFYQYVSKEFKYPLEAQKNKITGRLIISFVVEKDGSLSGIRVLRDQGNGLGEEAVRMLKNSPKWVAGMQNGKPIRVMYTLPIMVQPKPETNNPQNQ